MLTKFVLSVAKLLLRRFHVLALRRQGYTQTHAAFAEYAVRHREQARQKKVELGDAALDVAQNNARSFVLLVQPIHHPVDLIQKTRTPRRGLG